MSALLKLLLENADLLDELVDLISSGASKESIKAALRAVKVKVSDEAIQEELGFK